MLVELVEPQRMNSWILVLVLDLVAASLMLVEKATFSPRIS